MKIDKERSNKPRDERALVQSAAGGDPEACREIFDRLVDMVFHISYIYTDGDREAARDLAQTVFMKFFENLDSLKPPYKYAAWCAKIAHNCGIDYLKARAKDQVDRKEYAKVYEGQIENPERLLLTNEFMRTISEAFQRDTDQDLHIAGRMFYRDGMSVAQIASELGIPQSTVTTRVSRFRSWLREFIARKLEEG